MRNAQEIIRRDYREIKYISIINVISITNEEIICVEKNREITY